MSWIAIVLWIVENIPSIISLIKQIIAIFHTLPADQGQTLRQTISDAIQTGDIEKVKSVVQDQCKAFGWIGCPSQLVGE